MERALDLGMLREGLRGREALPTPEELASLLSETEMTILAGSNQIDEQLIETSWHLHSIGSSYWAYEAFGAGQKISALKIAAHGLDLALQCREMPLLERLQYCFASQVAYVRSGLDPNAIALFSREIKRPESTPKVEDGELAALLCATAALAMNVTAVNEIARPYLSQSRALSETWQVESITNTIFGAAALVVNGAQDLCLFLKYGDVGRLTQARIYFERAVKSVAANGDRLCRWVAAHLLDVSDDLRGSSIWTALPPAVPVQVRRSFTINQPRILTLWPPQAQFFTGGRHPLDPTITRLFLATPTSGGKTLLAQLIVGDHVGRGESAVCYVAPTRSLCHEIRTQMARRLRAIRASVSSDLPPFESVGATSTTVSVEVMTPERLSYLLRSDADALLARFGLFIFDEVHNVAEGGRGWTLESTLSFLNHETANTNHRLVLISAVAGNQAHFVQWLGGEENPAVLACHSEWRAPRRLHCIYTADAKWDEPTVQPVRRSGGVARTEFPMVGHLHVRGAGVSDLRTLEFNNPVGTLVLRSSKGKKVRDPRSTPGYKTLVPLVLHLARTGPVLVIESTRSSATRMAGAIASSNAGLPSAPADLLDLVDSRLGEGHPLARMLRAGVAYHHGSLPPEVRTAIEETISFGGLKCLVATTTMTEGINLPVQSVVIAAQGSYGPAGYSEYITGSKLINAIGRAGRATRETRGVVVLARPAEFIVSDFDKLDPNTVDTTVLSTLVTQEALAELAEFERLRSDGIDATLVNAGRKIEGFLQFVWFVASRIEEINGSVSLAEIETVLGRTFGWVQMDEPNKRRWLSAADSAVGTFQSILASTRKKWARAGTSIPTAERLDAVAVGVVREIEQLPMVPDVQGCLAIILSDERLPRLLGVPEAPSMRVYTARGGRRTEVAVPIGEFVRDWVAGTDLIVLANRYFGDVSDPDFRFEQLSEYLNEYLETFLPWVLGTIVSWANESLNSTMSLNRIPTEIPAYVRYGVDSSASLSLMIDGVRSRTLARKVALAWTAGGFADDVRTWLGSLGVPAWRELFDASPGDLRSLLDYAKPVGGGLMAALLAGDAVDIDVSLNTPLDEGTMVQVTATESMEIAPIYVVWDGSDVGAVASRHQSDLHVVIESGIPFECTVVMVADTPKLRITSSIDSPEILSV